MTNTPKPADPQLLGAVQTLMHKFGPPNLLRAITIVARQHWDEASKEYYERFRKRDSVQTPKERERTLSPSYEPSRRDRRERDLMSRWLRLNVDHAADSWDECTLTAGMSNLERCEREKSRRAAQLRLELKSIEKSSCP